MYKATTKGPVPLSQAEEAEILKKQQEWEAGALDRRIAELTRLRREKETAGIILDGTEIMTDDRSQAKLNGAWVAVQIDPDRTIHWKGASGWVTVGADEINKMAAAVADYVQACFDREAELAEALKEDINADISQGWPER